ncbi:Pep3/Vps18/deep orange family protein [Cardiosporidium cionae]|uniref:Pep3/Vps18/deep orange family protein n=1 Tax=Cardiosporidium cionae TaxID=476202 RepID=A0ABQ7J896_9APIC|nr:Pep3/Vps18/deep orange family protein [Cardiosporidium cionae]|eukprot:KAF8820213.1 Pep3/Vps18/deep orange family protein [Cardiosporidium cionae]
MKRLMHDIYDGTVWMYSESYIYEIVIQYEECNSWKLYLKRNLFSSALRHCHTLQEREEVIQAEADALCDAQKYILSAPKYAILSSVRFEDVCLKFLRASENEALLQFLKCKLSQLRPSLKLSTASESPNATLGGFPRQRGTLSDRNLSSSPFPAAASSASTNPQQIMLFMWIVEVYLHMLNALEDLKNQVQPYPHTSSPLKGESGRDAVEMAHDAAERIEKRFKEIQKELFELFEEFKNVDEVQASMYTLLHSHGRSEELLFYAEERNDYEALIIHHINHENYKNVIEKLKLIVDLELRNALLHRFSSVLFLHEPEVFISFLLSDACVDVNISSLIPALLHSCYQKSPIYISEAIRLLEHFAMASSPPTTSSSSLDPSFAYKQENLSLQCSFLGEILNATSEGNEGISNKMKGISVFGEEEGNTFKNHHSHENLKEMNGWEGPCGIWNCLLLLLADSNREDDILRLLSSPQIEKKAQFDGQFLLRVFEEKNCRRASVLLQGLIGMHQDAVIQALNHGFLSLAKHVASRPSDESVKKRLWLRIVEHLAERENLSELMHLVYESEGLLKVQDVLPYMADSTIIDTFKEDICETLDAYEQRIASKRLEIEDHRKSAASLKEELRTLNQRCVILSSTQVCDVCCKSIYLEKFYTFTCGHSFHASCTKKLKYPTFGSGGIAQYNSLNQQIEEALLAKDELTVKNLEARIDDILADDCLLCGNVMIESITQHFVSTHETDEELQSWAI